MTREVRAIHCLLPAALTAAGIAAWGCDRRSVVDAVTTSKVKAAIAADSAMKDSDISVRTDSGIVALSGKAKSADQINVANNLAQRQSGIAGVEISVTVK